MRGNFGSKQALVYAPNNNRAYDSYDNQLNPALNYEPRLIGAKSKRNYFCVKTKSSVRLTNNAKTAMSLLGALGAIYGGLVRDKMSTLYINSKGVYDDYVAEGYSDTFRKFLSGPIMDTLRNHMLHIILNSTNHHAEITNPWVAVQPTDPAWNVDIPFDIYAKFFNKLGNGGTYYVNGEPSCFTNAGKLWYYYVSSGGTYTRLNNPGFTISRGGLSSPITLNGYYIVDEDTGAYQYLNNEIHNGQKFYTTDVAP